MKNSALMPTILPGAMPVIKRHAVPLSAEDINKVSKACCTATANEWGLKIF